MESTPATTKTTEMTGASSLTVVNTAQATNDLGNTSPVGTENFDYAESEGSEVFRMVPTASTRWRTLP